MKRLETLLPHLKPGKLDLNSHTFSLEGITTPLRLTHLGASFLQLCNGTNSIKEICVLVFNRESTFSFIEIYESLQEWSQKNIFKNSEDIAVALKSSNSKEAPKNIPVKELDSAHLLLALRKVSLFSNFSENALKHIISISKQQKYSKGQTIVHKGTAAKEAFVVLMGQAGVFLTAYVNDSSEPLARLPAGSIFGESSALANQRRTADVIALCETQILSIPVNQVADPEISGGLDRNLRLRLMFSQMIKTHPLFKKLPADGVQLLLSGCRVERVSPGATVIHQGDEGQDFYFILSGKVFIEKDGVRETQLMAGAYFGEMGGLLKQTRSASVITDTECIFLILSIKNFISILASHLNLAMEIERTVQSRKNSKEDGAAVPSTADGSVHSALDLTVSPLDTTIPPGAHELPAEPSYTNEITLELSHNMAELENFDFSGHSQAEE